MVRSPKYLAAIALLACWPAAAQDPPESPAVLSTGESSAAPGGTASQRLLAAIDEPGLREVIGEVLERNPGIAAAQARARAAAERAPQARALPDPMASLTGFVATPETRTGPQRFSAAISQAFPWSGKRALREQSALLEATALQAEVEARRLKLVTEVRRLHYELAFLARQREITEELRSHLLQHEEIARARYSTGIGLGQSVVKLQAEITRVENRLLDLDTRRVALVAQLNSLRDRPASTFLSHAPLPGATEVPLDLDELLSAALLLRPELGAAEARISRAATLARLAEKGYRPDFTVGLTYTVVDSRDDTAGRLLPPEGNGDDVFGIQAGVTLPIWRKRLAAGVGEAMELELAAERAKREVANAVRTAVGDLAQRVPLSWRQLRLVEDLLVVQAEESLQSAQAAYIAGTLNALDLLDAEHVLFEAQTAVARAQADYLIGLARLEGEVGRPLEAGMTMERSES